MYQDDTSEIISQSDHSFNTIKNPNSRYMSIIGWGHIRFLVKILASSETGFDYAIRCTWVLSFYLYR